MSSNQPHLVGDSPEQSTLTRALYALPLFALALTSFRILNVEPAMAWALTRLQSGTFPLSSSQSSTSTTIPILRTFYRIPGLDSFIALINTLFYLPSLYNVDPIARQQLLSFLTDTTVPLTIWILESARPAHARAAFNILHWPGIFTFLGQGLGIGPVATVFCVVHYVFSPRVTGAATQDLNELIIPAASGVGYASFPVLVVTYLAPLYAALVWPERGTRQALMFVWQLYPVWLAAGLWVGARVFSGAAAGSDEEGGDAQEGLRVMKWYIGTAAALGAGVWWWSLAQYGLRRVFVPVGLPRNMKDLAGFGLQFLRWDQIFEFGSLLVWLAYLFWDLEAAGMLTEGWLKVVGLGLVSLLTVGPGATVGLGWLLREHILVTRAGKLKGA